MHAEQLSEALLLPTSTVMDEESRALTAAHRLRFAFCVSFPLHVRNPYQLNTMLFVDITLIDAVCGYYIDCCPPVTHSSFHR